MNTQYILGRGNSKASRANLKFGASARRWFVFERGAGIGWTPVFGPFFQTAAIEVAKRLEAMNHTGETLYTVATEKL